MTNTDSRFANSFPLAAPADAHWTDTVVTQGHADYCAAHGHADFAIDGRGQSYCPRCGDDLATHRAFGIGAPAPVIAEIPTPQVVAERADREALDNRWSFGWSWSYALTHTVVRGHAEIVDGRRWDDAASAEA